MKIRRKRRSTLTFTVLTNDAKKGVKQFRINKYILYSLFALPVIPIIALVHYSQLNLENELKIQELSTSLKIETSRNEHLQETVAVLEEETGETKERLGELTELERKMREYINELPTMIEPSGGPSGGPLVLTAGTSMELSEDGFTLLPSKELLDRYKETLTIIEEVSSELQYIPTAWPTIPNTITSDYGVRNDPIRGLSSYHSGVDIRGWYGTPVYATADGFVSMAKYFGSYGNAVKIKHSGTYETLYGHLTQIKVKTGDVVKKGDIIGTIGSTGRSTGPHLHYEVLKKGEPVDPKSYFNLYGEFDIE